MADLFSPAVFGWPRAIDELTAAEADVQAGLQTLMLNARRNLDIARLKGDVAGEAEAQRHVDWLHGVLADYETRIYQARVAGEKLIAIPSTEGGRSVDDQLHDEATVVAARRHHAEIAAPDEAEEAHRQGAVEARIRRLERDDRAERMASQALAIVERRR